ncbi:unnamed protein product [Hermetia illucens]|uniref:Major facilitator superfamily (MFS) profile domain-containing protein n=1 Tax=Hermetia illucens TaxID=343691 RepID=A0A7R8UXB1_HERIL|nr:unnamed protein product [Hermetia illucens]
MESNSVNRKVLRKYKNQIFATLAVNIITFSQGHSTAWCAPSLPLLQSENSPLPSGPITVEEASWIGSTVCIGGILGTFLFGILVDQLGRKKALYLLTIPHTGFWLLIIFGTTAIHLCVARLLSGISGFGAFIVIPIFVADISDSKIRGALGSIVTITFNAGLLSGFILASHLSYSLYPRIIIGLAIVYIFAIYSLPETPQYLIKNKRNDEAENALRFYRSFEASTEEERQKFKEDLTIQKDTKNEDMEKKVNLSYRDFLKPAAVRALLVSLGVLFLNQACGMFALLNYTVNLFKRSGSSMDPNTCTIIVGAIQLVGALLASKYVDKLGRRILLITSCLGVALGSFALASFSFLSSTMDLSSIKATAVTFCLCFHSVVAFIILKVYPIMIIDLGVHGVMAISGAVCVLGAVGTYLFMPETKGKDLNISEDG